MCKKVLVLALMLGLASVSFADVIAGNWETDLEGWVNGNDAGWNNGNEVGIAAGQTVGVTLGSGSLVAVDAQPGWNWDMVVATWNGGVTFSAADVIANSKLEFDVTRQAADNGDISWSVVSVSIQIQYDDGTGNEMWVNQQYENLGEQWGTWAGDRTDHIVVDYSAQVYPDSSVWNVQIAIGTNNNGTVGGVTYYDNVQLTPEPATIAMLGLGGLALIRRKK